MTEELLIKSARLWDGVSREVLHNTFLLVKDGMIDAIGKQDQLGEDSPLSKTATVYDLGDVTLLPGLINLHTHLTFNASNTVLADYFKERDMGIPTLTVRAIDNMHRSIRVGVTTIRDCGTLNEIVFGIRAAVENGMLIGPRVVASGNGITTTGGHCYYFGIEADNEDEVRKAVRSQVKAGADFIKIFSTGGGLTPGTNPVAAQYTETQMIAAVQEAHRLGKFVSSHAHGTVGVRNSVKAAVDTIEHCTFMTPTSIEYDEHIAQEIAEKGIYVVPTAGIAMSRRLAKDPDYGKTGALARFVASREKRMANLHRMHQLGVTIVSGSDSGIPDVFFEDFPADVTVVVTEMGLSNYTALTSATSNAAKAAALTDTGVLAVGKRADLLAVAGNPLENIQDLTRTCFVATKGKVAVS